MNIEHLQEPEKIKVAGHLEDKRGIYQMILSWKWPDGKRDRRSISTELPTRGNKKRAEAILGDTRKSYPDILMAEWQEKQCAPQIEANSEPNEMGDMLFADFMENVWLESLKPKVKQKEMKLTTFGGYQKNVKKIISPYFREKGITLSDLTSENINAFYDERYKVVKPATVARQHANIYSALKYAKTKKYIPHFIMDDVRRPCEEKFKAKFLRQSEAVELFEAIKGHQLELPVIMAAFYGLRRSEVVGLKWVAIDFDANSISIEHTVTIADVDGKKIEVAEDSTKSRSSTRTLPLMPQFRKKLLEMKAEQEYHQKLCGNAYDLTGCQYICVNQLGRRIKPDRITEGFPKFMVENGFRRIRFHDLRHSCASLLLANGVSLKEIQDWLGHSSFAITADTYAHLEFESKLRSAQAMTWIDKTSLSESQEHDNQVPNDKNKRDKDFQGDLQTTR